MNNKGFTTIAFIALAPLLCTLTYFCFWSLWFMEAQMKIQNICHQGVLQAQQELVSSNNQIMNLNTKAYALYLEKIALNAVILTGPPPAKVLAKARKKWVIGQQRVLQQLQRMLFKKSHFLSQSALYSMKTKLYSTHRQWHQFWKTPFRPPSIQVHTGRSQLAVKIKDIASVYRRLPGHENKQRISVRWASSLQTLIPAWVQSMVPLHQTWIKECHSHPHKGGQKWQASLGEGKHSLKHLSSLF